jgi:type I restriction enzyme, S subunit
LYLAYTLLSNSESLLRLTTAATHGTKRFDTEDLFSFEFALPKDKQEQDSIVKIIETCDTQLVAEKNKLRKLSSIKRGLMQDLLTGKVDVDSLFTEHTVVSA